MLRLLLTQFVFVGLFAIQCFAESRQRAEEFLANIYTSDHMPMLDREIDFTNRDQLTKYFDQELTKLFLEDAKCMQKEKGICNLDFDPLYDAQDYADKTTNLAVRRVANQRETFKVTFTNLGNRTLVYKLAETSRGWRITNIMYPKGLALKELLSKKRN